MDPFRDLSRIAASTTELRSATDDYRHWTSAHNVAGCLRCDTSQPVNRCHPLIQPPSPFFSFLGLSTSPHGPLRRRCALRLAGYLCRSSTIAAARGKAHSKGLRGRWRRAETRPDGDGGAAGREGGDEVSMGARWNHSRAANRRVCCRPGKSRRDVKAQVVDPTQARIAASGWSRGAP